MVSADRPRLVGLEIAPFHYQGEEYLRLASREGLSDEWLALRREAAWLLHFFDGRHTIPEIIGQIGVEAGESLPEELLADLVRRLDEIYVLDTPRRESRLRQVLDEFRKTPVRDSSHAGGVYPTDAAAARARIEAIFQGPGGPGLPTRFEGDGSLRGILSPHIDFQRGGTSFAWGFRELAEKSDATVFVIVGTSHYSAERFILTRKDFRTPLGIARCHMGFVERLASVYGAQGFEDELAHKPEHSIEFQVLFLQYLLGGRRDFTIVPVLVGSFHDATEKRVAPRQLDDVCRMVDALRQAEASCGERVCYIVSGDLAHVGRKFGDPWPVDAERAEWCRTADLALLQQLERPHADTLAARIADEQDERRICGFPPMYVMLDAAAPSSGRLLCYDQFVDPRGFEIVSFASMAFYR